MIGENAGAAISNNNKYLLGTVRNYGLYILDINNINSPILVNKI